MPLTVISLGGGTDKSMQFKSDFFQFRAARHRNREVFLANYPRLIKAMPTLLETFDTLTETLVTRGADGNSHVGLIPLVRLAQRQAQAAFDSVSSFQAYEAWLLVRPAIEAVLIIGKWLEDPANAQIWAKRFQEPGPYRKAYQGKNLQSKSIPDSPRIQAALSLINDWYSHPNPSYVFRHTSVASLDQENVVLKFEYFDPESTVETACIGLLHLVLTLEEALRTALAPKFPSLKALDLGLAAFHGEFLPRARELGAMSEENRRVLTDLGLYVRLAT